jgi:phosphoribosylformimino-5-aminoimidazole carboxamide ribotide isomerase
VARIVQSISIPVELGGGLRTRDDVARTLDMGVHWAIMGTSALSNRPEVEKSVAEFGDRIIVGIDAKNGKAAVDGWVRTSDVTAIELARAVEAIGVKRIIFTDISTDGMLAGPNLDSTRAMCEAVSMEVTASGGVTTLDDIRKLRMLEALGVSSCIVGRALYSGTVDLREAIAAGRTY